MKKQTMGERIATLRKEKKMTQLQLAELMGVTDKAVSKWERDLSYPDINAFPKLAEVLDVSVEELLQIKTNINEKDKKVEVKKIVNVILKAIPLAMGVSVVMLSILDKMEASSGVSMLGIGLFCLAMERLSDEKIE